MYKVSHAAHFHSIIIITKYFLKSGENLRAWFTGAFLLGYRLSLESQQGLLTITDIQ